MANKKKTKKHYAYVTLDISASTKKALDKTVSDLQSFAAGKAVILVYPEPTEKR